MAADMTSSFPLVHWADYVAFSLSLVLSLAVGVYYGCVKKLRPNIEEFFLGERNLRIIPVTISLFVSWFSALSVLGEPVEIYYYGAVFWYVAIGYVLGLLPVALYFAPLYHGMKFISICEVSVFSITVKLISLNEFCMVS